MQGYSIIYVDHSTTTIRGPHTVLLPYLPVKLLAKISTLSTPFPHNKMF
jgi:hypothetical protein